MKISSIEIHNDQIGQWVKNKRINVLILRFIASLFVIMLHIRYILNNGCSSNSVAFSIVEVFALPAVNIFIICSAIASFGKSKNNYKRYSMIVMLLYAIAIIDAITKVARHQNINYAAVLLPFIFYDGLWYLRVYVIVYPLIPMLNKAIQTKKDSLIFVVFYFIFTITQYAFIREYNISNGYHILHFIFLHWFTRSCIILFFDLYYKNSAKKLFTCIPTIKTN